MVCVERINDQPHRRFRVSRRERFETIEKAKLKLLPITEFDGGDCGARQNQSGFTRLK